MRLAGEPDSPLNPAGHHPVLRSEALAHDRVDLALLCMSSPLGVEALPRDEAQPLLDAWHAGVAGLAGLRRLGARGPPAATRRLRRAGRRRAPARGAPRRARRGPASAVHDPLLFYDTSSYGPRALDAVIRVTGIDALVHGSDRPVVGGPLPSRLGRAPTAALRTANPARPLHGAGERARVAA